MTVEQARTVLGFCREALNHIGPAYGLPTVEDATTADTTLEQLRALIKEYKNILMALGLVQKVSLSLQQSHCPSIGHSSHDD